MRESSSVHDNTMGTETLTIKNDKNKSDQSEYSGSELLSQWLTSLESRSSFFWLHYVECNIRSREHGYGEHGEIGRCHSVETPESGCGTSASSDYTEDSSLETSTSFTDHDGFSGKL